MAPSRCIKEARLAWYNSQYVCPECGAVWDSEWSCRSDDQCPECEIRDITPISSEDLTIVVEPNGAGLWTIWHSPPEADDAPCYAMVGRLKPTKSGTFNFVTHAKLK